MSYRANTSRLYPNDKRYSGLSVIIEQAKATLSTPWKEPRNRFMSLRGSPVPDEWEPESSITMLFPGQSQLYLEEV